MGTIAAKTAWDIVPEEKVYNAAAVRGESVLSMLFTKVFVCIKCVYMQIYQSNRTCSKYICVLMF